MPEAALVPAGRGRAALTGILLPSPPPTRVYISDLEYRLAAPRVALPPIINVAKAVLNWTNVAGQVAKNILHFLAPTTGYPMSDPSKLLDLANKVMTTLASGVSLSANISSNWTLQSCTCHDLGGTSAFATSTTSSVPGSNPAAPFPPQVAVVLSWQVASSYRGGKPRTYLPGIPQNAIATTGSSALSTTYATALEGVAASFRGIMNGYTPTGASGPTTVGTVSYFHGHTVRPTPVFMGYIDVSVHERLDSQRRRSGQESAFGVIP